MAVADPIMILLLHPHLNRLAPQLEAMANVCRDEDLDIDPTLAANVRIIATIGTVPVPELLLDRLPRLGAVVCGSAGYDAIDVRLLARRGILLANAAGAGDDSVAELALALTLAAVRGILDGDTFVRQGEWSAADRGTRRRSMQSAKVGIVGLGGIGKRAGHLFSAIGADVAWWGPRPKPAALFPRVPSLLALAEQSDILVLTPPLTDETRGMIDRSMIDALGPNGLLVNVARGPIVDEEALRHALVTGRLGGAALDVYAEEPTPADRWVDVPNVLLSPHVGAYTFDALQRLNDSVVANIAQFLRDGTLVTPVKA